MSMPRAVLSAILRALLVATLLVTGWSAEAAREAAAPGPAQTIASAISVASDDATFPSDVIALMQTLPDDWSISRPGYEGSVWYRVRFDVSPFSDPEAVLALYVERACTNLEVHLNGHRIFSGGRMEEPVTRNCYQPQLIALPAAPPGARRPPCPRCCSGAARSS